MKDRYQQAAMNIRLERIENGLKQLGIDVTKDKITISRIRDRVKEQHGNGSA